jgi:hypothetical protein
MCRQIALRSAGRAYSADPRDIPRWRGGRAAEGARLESVYTGNRIEGSNPSPSANTSRKSHAPLVEAGRANLQVSRALLWSSSGLRPAAEGWILGSLKPFFSGPLDCVKPVQNSKLLVSRAYFAARLWPV